VRLLLLGGPKFLGRAVADAALARGHEVTFFNRGETNPQLYPEVEKLRGDRDGGLTPLQGREWDAVVDTSGYVPRLVRDSAELLAPSAGRYAFVSSVSVYASFAEPIDEQSPLATVEDETTEDVRAHYGALKALCEEVVEDAFPDRSILVRPGLIVGPHDPTERFTYWPERVARGGEVLAPGSPDRPLQFVDARDLAEWIVLALESEQTGPFNATGPARPVTMGELLQTCGDVSGSDASPTWVDEAFLADREVGEWMELPLWLDSRDPDSRHFMDVDIGRAVTAGLRFRPLAETVGDTLAWVAARDGRGEGTAAMGSADAVGLDPARERELLADWHGQVGQ
jgi:2'-hydroxyisoflavone reductase